MKTEFLQNFKVGDQALQKEIIDAILAENGRDIEAAKKPFADYESVKEQLKTAKISIHASRLGSDPAVPPRKPNIFQFQSTLPVWGATDENNQRIITAAFQSTLPVWGATAEILNKSPAKRDKEQE